MNELTLLDVLGELPKDSYHIKKNRIVSINQWFFECLPKEERDLVVKHNREISEYNIKAREEARHHADEVLSTTDGYTPIFLPKETYRLLDDSTKQAIVLHNREAKLLLAAESSASLSSLLEKNTCIELSEKEWNAMSRGQKKQIKEHNKKVKRCARR